MSDQVNLTDEQKKKYCEDFRKLHGMQRLATEQTLLMFESLSEMREQIWNDIFNDIGLSKDTHAVNFDTATGKITIEER